jgi:hypothetical protein
MECLLAVNDDSFFILSQSISGRQEDEGHIRRNPKIEAALPTAPLKKSASFISA